MTEEALLSAIDDRAEHRADAARDAPDASEEPVLDWSTEPARSPSGLAWPFFS